MKLEEVIVQQSRIRGIDPYRQALRPADLGIRASDYGSFSDHCSKDVTCSGKWNPEAILKVAEWTRSGEPLKYVLVDKKQ